MAALRFVQFSEKGSREQNSRLKDNHRNHKVKGAKKPGSAGRPFALSVVCCSFHPWAKGQPFATSENWIQNGGGDGGG